MKSFSEERRRAIVCVCVISYDRESSFGFLRPLFRAMRSSTCRWRASKFAIGVRCWTERYAFSAINTHAGSQALALVQTSNGQARAEQSPRTAVQWHMCLHLSREQFFTYKEKKNEKKKARKERQECSTVTAKRCRQGTFGCHFECPLLQCLCVCFKYCSFL